MDAIEGVLAGAEGLAEVGPRVPVRFRAEVDREGPGGVVRVEERARHPVVLVAAVRAADEEAREDRGPQRPRHRVAIHVGALGDLGRREGLLLEEVGDAEAGDLRDDVPLHAGDDPLEDRDLRGHDRVGGAEQGTFGARSHRERRGRLAAGFL